MRILLVNRFFGGSQTPTGRMLKDVAERLSSDGHDVVVLTSRGGYVGTERASVGSGTTRWEIRLIRQAGSLPRILNWGWFWFVAVVRIPLMRWDRCLLLTDPPFLPVAAALTRLLRGQSRRIFWWTMDLYPEALDAAGILRRGTWFYRILERLVEFGFRGLDGVIALGARQRERLLKYRGCHRGENFCIVVPPWDNRSLPRPSSDGNPVVRRLGWEGFKIALYAGNLGEAHEFREFIEGARWFQSQSRKEWLFVFVVRGSGVPALTAEVAGLPNVRVIDYLPEAETASLLWSATVHLVSMKPGWDGVVVPSKLYGILGTEAPVLFIGPEQADISGEIARFQRGKALPSHTDGAAVAVALDELTQAGWRHSPATDAAGIGRVVEFVRRS